MSVTLGQLRFIDSIQFLAASLDELVKGCGKFDNLIISETKQADLQEKVFFHMNNLMIRADLMKQVYLTREVFIID